MTRATLAASDLGDVAHFPTTDSAPLAEDSKDGPGFADGTAGATVLVGLTELTALVLPVR